MIQSVTFDEKRTKAVVLSCGWNIGVIMQPAEGPDDTNILVNDLKNSYDHRSEMILDHGKWFVSTVQVVAKHEGVISAQAVSETNAPTPTAKPQKTSRNCATRPACRSPGTSVGRQPPARAAPCRPTSPRLRCRSPLQSFKRSAADTVTPAAAWATMREVTTTSQVVRQSARQRDP